MPTEAETQAALEAENKKVTFSPEQQAKVQEIVDQAVGRAGAPFKQQANDLAAEKVQLQSEITDLQTKLAKVNAKGGKGGDEAEALRNEIAEMKRAQSTNTDETSRLKQQVEAERKSAETARNEASDVRKSVAIQRAVNAANFVNNDIVEQLTKDSVKLENGKFVVVNEAGQPRMNAAFEPMTLNEFYAEFAAKNPYLVRSDVKAGQGSTQSSRYDVSRDGKLEVKQVFGKDSSAKLAMELKKSNPAEYARLKQIAISGGLIGARS